MYHTDTIAIVISKWRYVCMYVYHDDNVALLLSSMYNSYSISNMQECFV